MISLPFNPSFYHENHVLNNGERVNKKKKRGDIMKTDSNKQHFKFFERTNNSKPSERKQMSDFVKKMKMNAQNSHLNGKNS
ncbi:hypothetical protein OKW24_000617 [Peribacillus simplex]|nr:hypothetical protein [Peribacillus simplex]